MDIPANLRDGIDNLLFNCIEAKAGDSLAIVTERGVDGYYSATLDGVIAAHARERSLNVSLVVAPVLEEVSSIPDEIQSAVESADHILFLARIGDQLRFSELSGIGQPTVCYALDEASFGTAFCSAHYKFFVPIVRSGYAHNDRRRLRRTPLQRTRRPNPRPARFPPICRVPVPHLCVRHLPLL